MGASGVNKRRILRRRREMKASKLWVRGRQVIRKELKTSSVKKRTLARGGK